MRDRFVAFVFDRDLRFSVGPQPRDFARLADAGEFAPEFVREGNRRGHELRRFVAGEAKHQTLVAGALFGRAFALGGGVIDALFDVAAIAR